MVADGERPTPTALPDHLSIIAAGGSPLARLDQPLTALENPLRRRGLDVGGLRRPSMVPRHGQRLDASLVFLGYEPAIKRKDKTMLHYAAVFLIIALIAAVFGFGGIAAGAASIAKILFVVFLIGAIVAFLMNGRSRI
jgi:uncharacterized membrane protein YtjA (UPF0391 family)